MSTHIRAVTSFAAVLIAIAIAAPVHAQSQYKQAISANPFGLLLELFNGEFERVISESATAGIGGSFFDNDDDDYLNADLFARYYPQGTPLEGWAFGGKIGITKVEWESGLDAGERSGTYFGFGFDVNRSWLLGKNNNFYVGVGFGLKRLINAPKDDGFGLDYIPTFRIVNVGFAF